MPVCMPITYRVAMQQYGMTVDTPAMSAKSCLCAVCPSTATRQHEDTCWHTCHFPSPTCCSMGRPGYSYTKSYIVAARSYLFTCEPSPSQPQDSDGSPFVHLVSQQWYLEAWVCLFISIPCPSLTMGELPCSSESRPVHAQLVSQLYSLVASS